MSDWNDEIIHRESIVNGCIVKHFKRELCDPRLLDKNFYLYKVLGNAKHSETGEDMIVYQALYGSFVTYVRPYESFFGKVDKDKYPRSTQIFRFERYYPEGDD